MKYCALFCVLSLGLWSCGETKPAETVLTDTTPEVTLPTIDGHTPLQTNPNAVDSTFILPNPTGWVNDGDYLFTESDRLALDSLIEAHHQVTGNSIYVVTLSGPEPYPNMEQYVVALGNSWNTNTDTTVNSAIISICVPLQDVRVESSDAYDSNYSDEKSPEVIFGVMMPEFANGNFVQGIQKGVKETISYYNLIHASRKEKGN